MNPHIPHQKEVKVLHTSVTSITIWKWSYHLFKNIPVIKVATRRYPVWNWSIHYSSIWTKKLFKNHPCNQSIQYEKYNWFPLHKGHSHATTKSILFLSTKMNGTQSRTLVSPWKYIVHIVVCQRDLSGCWIVKKILAHSLSCYSYICLNWYYQLVER